MERRAERASGDGGAPGLAQRLWTGCRPELAVLAAGCLLAGLAWRFTPRPMGDTPTYRAAARGLADGWPSLLQRTPGYPLLLLATGAGDRSTVLLFVAQLLLHAACVLLVVDLARSCGVGRRGRVAAVVLLLAPPVLLRVLLEGSEALAAFALTLVLWLLLTPARRPVPRALAVGVVCGAAALVRPTFALLFLPAAVCAAWTLAPRRPTGGSDGSDEPDAAAVGRVARRRWALAGAVALPAVLLVGGYSLVNAVRFDSPGLTPLTAYHLSSRTSAYVEELPASYEPARSVLVRARDRALLRGEEYAPANFIWTAKGDLERATGLRGRALERYLLGVDLHLISHHPFDYLDAVLASTTDLAAMDSQPAVLGVGRPVVWSLAALHWVLAAGALLLAATVPGLWLAGRVDARRARTMAVAVLLAGYTAAVSVMVESGTARLRAPAEPALVLALVVGASCLLAQLRTRRAGTGAC